MAILRAILRSNHEQWRLQQELGRALAAAASSREGCSFGSVCGRPAAWNSLGPTPPSPLSAHSLTEVPYLRPMVEMQQRNGRAERERRRKEHHEEAAEKETVSGRTLQSAQAPIAVCGLCTVRMHGPHNSRANLSARHSPPLAILLSLSLSRHHSILCLRRRFSLAGRH